MNARLSVIAVIWLAVLFSVACLQAATPAPTGAPSSKAAAVQRAATWQDDWDRTVAAARKEGKVVVSYSYGSTVREALQKAFREKYGIDVEDYGGFAPDQLTKISAERRAGLYASDVISTGMATMQGLPADAIEPMEASLILPEVKDVNVWREKKLPFSGPDKRFLYYLGRPGPTLGINTELVKPADVSSWRSLLAPRWKGQILLHDPSYSGAGANVVTAVREIMGVDYLRDLAKQQPLIQRDYRVMTEWVARGKNPLLIGQNVSIFEDMRNAGAPIANVVPQEGTYWGSGMGVLAIFDKAPHPNAAKVFINWLLSREGLSLLTKVAMEQSNRVDVPPVLPQDRLPQAGMRYVDIDTEEFSVKRREMMGLSKEIFAAQYK